MKKLFKGLILFILALTMSVPMYASELTVTSTAQESIVEKNIFCKHTHVDINKGSEVYRDCYKVGYNYTRTCVSCGKFLDGGTMYESFSTPRHSFTTVSLSCNGKQHTYEKRCRHCSHSESSFTVSCNGTCIEFSNHEH